jgi:integrase
MPRLTSRPLTQRLIDSTPPPARCYTSLRDHEQRGLEVRLRSTGARSWRFEYLSPVTGKKAVLSLPAGTLAEARVIAKSHRALVALGRDPAIEAEADLEARREAHAKAVNVAAVLDDYEQNVLASAVKQVSRRKRVRVLRRAMAGFEGRAVASLTRGDFIKRLDQIQAEAGDVSRNRAQSELRHFLGWCRDRDVIETIALDRVRRGVRETPRDRALTDEELKALMCAIGDGSAYSDLMRVLLHTAMRRNEAASLQARDLDFDARTIAVRAEVSKTRQSRAIPMDDALVDMLRERARGLKRDGFVFGEGSGFQRPFSGFSKPFARLWTMMPAGIDRWTLHDLRRTAATRLHQAGVDALVIEDLLGHLTGVRGGIAGVYNAATTLDRQRRALAGWRATLAALETSIGDATGRSPALSASPANVTRLGARR